MDSAIVSAYNKLYDKLTENEKVEKNNKLKNAAASFLAAMQPLYVQLEIIREKLYRQAEFDSVLQKIKKIYSDDAIDDQFNLLRAELTVQEINALSQEERKLLDEIYTYVDIFQKAIFEIWGLQKMIYVSVDAQYLGKRTFPISAYEFKPGHSISRVDGGGWSARVTKGGRRKRDEKDSSLNSILMGMAQGAGFADIPSQGKTNYQLLSQTYKEVMFRFKTAWKKDEQYDGEPQIWWFTDASHSDVGGMVYVGQAGDLAETFVSFIPAAILDSSEHPPYSGELDPPDVKKFIQGTQKVTNAKGRLLGDVTAIIEENGQKKILQMAVKGQKASHMEFLQMLDLANQIIISPNPLQTLIDIQIADEKAGVGRKQQILEGAQIPESTGKAVAKFMSLMKKDIRTTLGKT